VPPQPPHVEGEVPGLDLVPLHVPHTSVREKVSVLTEPLIASMKSTSRFIYRLSLTVSPYHYVLALGLLLGPPRGPPRLPALASEELLELLEDVPERVLPLARTWPLPKLIVEPLEASEALSPTEPSSERPSLSLLLFVSRHASLIVDPSL